MIWVALLGAVGVGLVLGALGGGGSTLIVPLLVYVVGMSEHKAAALSLLVVGAVAVVGTVMNARRGIVRWPTALLFALPSLLGAYLGGASAAWLPGWSILALFTALMLAASWAMWRGRGDLEGAEGAGEAHPGVLAIAGFMIGALTGLVGAGGGFVLVPALVLLARVPMREAAATSLAIICANAASGLAGHLSGVEIEWEIALPLVGAALLGLFVGMPLSRRIPAARLRRGFAVMLCVLAVAMAIEQLAGLFKLGG